MSPLPQLYRLVIAGVVVVLSLAGGVWLTRWLELPLGGVGVGFGAGCLLAYAATRSWSSERHDEPAPRRR